MQSTKFSLFFLLPAIALTTVACPLHDLPRAPEPVLPGASHSAYPFQNPELPLEERIDNILALMTLDEKIAALSTDPGVPRLGIKGSRHIEGLHGVALGGPGDWGKGKPQPTTQFPQSVGLAETWDPELLQRIAIAESIEARYLFQNPDYARGGLVIRAPNADLARDPRWGRSEESFGEDPYLTGAMTAAFVRGLQGDHPRYWRAAALLKHFMANSNENDRLISSSDFDARLLHEYYAAPFRTGIVDAGARAYMTAYNAVNGVPMTAHPALKEITVAQWGQDGIICTDAGSMTFMFDRHHYYPSLEHAAAASIKAGINQFLEKNYQPAVRGALASKLLTEADIDSTLRGVYRVMIRLGLLDPPSMVPYSTIGSGPESWQQKEHKQLARLASQKSIVLLKNTGILPLDIKKLKTIAVIGPYADQVLLDWYSGTPPYTVSPLRGIRDKARAIKVVYVPKIEDDKAVQLVAKADVAIVVVGNHPTCDAGWEKCPVPSDGKEAVDRRAIELEQEALVASAHHANPRTVVVLRSSFPHAINWSQAMVPAILHLAHNSQEEGNALADALFGDVNPGGRLVTTWPASIEHLPPLLDYNLRKGRTYLYSNYAPLYPFGYGLSYTSFAYSSLKTSAGSLPANGSIGVSVDIENTGSRAGDEVVQLYVRHPNSKIARPVRELKGFKRITLQPGEKQQVTLALAAKELAWFNVKAGAFAVEPGKIIIEIGRSSAEIELQQTISVTP
jgi:beta-glucosidase